MVREHHAVHLAKAGGPGVVGLDAGFLEGHLALGIDLLGVELLAKRHVIKSSCILVAVASPGTWTWNVV